MNYKACLWLVSGDLAGQGVRGVTYTKTTSLVNSLPF